jgi:uncharacterized coiled-coil protein SlyX
MGYLNNDVGYDDVHSAVQSLLDGGQSLADISLRDIREAMGDRGSLSTISKHLKPIKARLERGEALDAVDLSETDMDALRTLVRDIVERRTFLERKEKEDSAQATSDVIRAHEADLAMKDEVIDDFEHQVFALEGESGAQSLIIDDLNAQVARLEGMVEALNATIVTLLATRNESAVTKADVVENQPPAKKADRPNGGQAETPLVTSDGADQADVAGDDRG